MIGHCISGEGPRAPKREKGKCRKRGGDPRVLWTTNGHCCLAWQGMASFDWFELDVTLNDYIHFGRL